MEYVKQLKASGARKVIVLHVNDERGNETVMRILGESQFEKLKKNILEENDWFS